MRKNSSPNRRSPWRTFRPRLELLEDRVAPATFTVTNTLDDGSPGSLRWAINQANADTDLVSAINFNIPGSGVQTIQVGSSVSYPGQPLPTISHPVILDGYSQPGASANTLTIGDNATLEIELNGASAGAGSNGLTITASGCTIRGLVINAFGAAGIDLTGSSASGNVVAGNYIGTNPSGSAAMPNGSEGVLIDQGAANNTIGGTVAGAANVISGNYDYQINARYGIGITVQGNFIGTDAAGTAALGGSGGGIEAGSGMIIGGTTAAARNIISGNQAWGIHISYDLNSITIQGNYIGTDVTGSHAILNGYQGVSVSYYSSGITIGGTAAGAGNVILGGYVFREAVEIAQGAHDNLVAGNLIGTDASGTRAFGLGGGVVLSSGAHDNTIGGTTATARNIISGNALGVEIETSAYNNFVEGNYIGTDITGTIALPNYNDGVFIYTGASNNTIGGLVSGAGNLISGNAIGLEIYGTGTTGNVVEGNLIGTNAAGTGALPNGGSGVLIDNGAANNTIGGTAAGAGNIIAFNSGAGVAVLDAGSVSNPIRGNSVHDNGGLGIDLGGSGVPVQNDSQGHIGPNNFQDFPILTSAITNKGGITIIAGSFSSPSQPNTSITVDFYANAAADPSGYGEGQIYLGSLTFTTSATGTFAIHNFKPSQTVPVGYYVTATATDPAGNTSEFGPDVLVTSPNNATHGMAQMTASSGSSDSGASGGALVPEDLNVYVDDSNGAFTADELTAMGNIISGVASLVSPYGVEVTEVTDPSQADFIVSMSATSELGGVAQGVLGVEDSSAGTITIVQGWNWYDGTDPSAITSSQYSFTTVFTHELGHALGLGESSNANSVMYALLPAGTIGPGLTVADLNVPMAEAGGSPQLAAPPPAVHASVPPVLASVTLERTRLEPGTINLFVSGAAARPSNTAAALLASPPWHCLYSSSATLDTLGAEHQDQDSRSGLATPVPLEGRHSGSGGGDNEILPVEEAADEESPEGLPPQLDTGAAATVTPAAPGAPAAEAPSPAAERQSALDAYFAHERWTQAGNSGSVTVPWVAAEDTDLACLRLQPVGSPAMAAATLAVVLSGYWAQPTERARRTTRRPVLK